MTEFDLTCETCGIDAEQWMPHPDGFQCLVCDDILDDDGTVIESSEAA